MKFRREDSNKFDFSATVSAGSNGPVATMTSVPQVGISAEDLLGAVIKLVADDTGTVMYVTLTSSVEESTTNYRVLTAFGIVNFAVNGTIMMVSLEHREGGSNGKVVSDTITLNYNRSAT